LEELLRRAAGAVSLGLEAMALVVIVIGAVEAALGMVRVVFNRHVTGSGRRAVWLEFSHWLVAALTFQLAADIVRTMVVPGWDDIGRVAAIAVIRTFLTFFLDRDIDTLRRRNAREGDHAGSA
jgi:uncharacterized membrane protein